MQCNRIHSTSLVLMTLLLSLLSCRKAEKIIEPSQIHTLEFRNKVEDTPEQNILNYLYFYNGAGVGVADLVGDSLPDIVLISNLGKNKLFENKGALHFEEVQQSGLDGRATWQTGVSIADVNRDGLNDIFICAVSGIHGFEGHNELYINQGSGQFVESAAKYGLDAEDYSTASAFFDYDLDGDLDLYLLNHAVHTEDGYRKPAHQLRKQREPKVGDRLYRNDAGRFVEVSEQAGILGSKVNYGLAVKVSDINQDGWPDLYISNDFHENDYCYLNEGNGHFAEIAERLFAYTTKFSMGNDIADINNDLSPDIFVADMQPFDYEIEKNSPAEDSPEIYEFKLKHGYHPQYARNALQLNYNGRFQEVAQLFQVNATDWSWSPIIADFNSDGKQDVFVSNGIWRRPNDLDFLNYISSDQIAQQLKEGHKNDVPIIEQMPSGLLPNVLFIQEASGFKNKGKALGFTMNDASNGVATADFDNDGDLDLVINRLNAPAIIWENHSQGDFLTITLVDEKGSPAIGAQVTIEQNGEKQMRELFPQRGFMSSSQPLIHFGLPQNDSVSITVKWPNQSQSVQDVLANQNIHMTMPSAKNPKPKAQTEWTTLPIQQPDFNSAAFEGNPLKPYGQFGREQLVTAQSGDYLVTAKPWEKVNISYQGKAIPSNAPKGFWQAVSFYDCDEDGDLDILMGNLGENNRLTASSRFPLLLYTLDYDGNGQEDYILASEHQGDYYPVLWKDQLAKTMPQIKKEYTDYHSFAAQNLTGIFGQLPNNSFQEITSLANGWLVNEGDHFQWRELPKKMQAGPITSIQHREDYLLVSGRNSDWIPTIGLMQLLEYSYINKKWTISPIREK